MALNDRQLSALQELRRLMELNTARFGNLHDDPRQPLPRREPEVDAFIKDRTRIWREAWVFPLIDELIDAEMDRRARRVR